jgi:Domain of unknown function (DUF3284)
MNTFSKNIDIDYPVEKIFNAFMDLNRREMPRFNKKNPTETEYSKIIRQVGKQQIRMLTRITAYEKNNLYEVTNSLQGDTYISRYEFKELNNGKTQVILTEKQDTGFLSKIFILFKSFYGRRKLKKKLESIKSLIEEEIARKG